jgi:GxxExxY protein
VNREERQECQEKELETYCRRSSERHRRGSDQRPLGLSSGTSGISHQACRAMRIDQLVLVENKTVETILPVHVAQLLTYLKLSGLSLGLIIN